MRFGKLLRLLSGLICHRFRNAIHMIDLLIRENDTLVSDIVRRVMKASQESPVDPASVSSTVPAEKQMDKRNLTQQASSSNNAQGNLSTQNVSANVWQQKAAIRKMQQSSDDSATPSFPTGSSSSKRGIPPVCVRFRSPSGQPFIWCSQSSIIDAVRIHICFHQSCFNALSQRTNQHVNDRKHVSTRLCLCQHGRGSRRQRFETKSTGIRAFDQYRSFRWSSPVYECGRTWTVS